MWENKVFQEEKNSTDQPFKYLEIISIFLFVFVVSYFLVCLSLLVLQI